VFFLDRARVGSHRIAVDETARADDSADAKSTGNRGGGPPDEASTMLPGEPRLR
jgi:hypothetical protein